MEPAVGIAIVKSERVLVLRLRGGAHVRYRVAIGRNSSNDKAVEGDCATPLGEFYVCAKNPRSRFYLSLCLSYPNARDAARGLAAGLIDAREHALIVEAINLRKMPLQHTRLGGEIYIHGLAAGREDEERRDWTRGCIAVDNAAMRDIYDATEIGTPVVITR